MGTYTTNYQLYMPTVGETGWGTLVNSNFSTIDTTMKNLSNRIAAVENEVNGNLSCASVTTSGKITGNGGVAGTTGTFSGAVTANKLKQTGVNTVTSGTPPTTALSAEWTVSENYIEIFSLPFNTSGYTGTITANVSTNALIRWQLGITGEIYGQNFQSSGGTLTITLNNAKLLKIWTTANNYRYVRIGNITFT